MKNKFKFLTAVSIVALSSAAFSSPSQVCPPVDLIKAHANFNKAIQDDDMWQVLDLTPYRYNDENWLTVVMVNLPGVSNLDEVYQRSREMLQRAELVMPEGDDPCVYAFSIVPFYAVAAIPESEVSDYKTKLLTYIKR